MPRGTAQSKEPVTSATNDFKTDNYYRTNWASQFKYFQSLQFNNAYNHFAMFDIVLIAGEVAEYSSPL